MDEAVINATNIDRVIEFSWVCPECDEASVDTTSANHDEVSVTCWNCDIDYIVRLADED